MLASSVWLMGFRKNCSYPFFSVFFLIHLGRKNYPVLVDKRDKTLVSKMSTDGSVDN